MIKLKNILFVLMLLFSASVCYVDASTIKNFISVNSAGGKASGNGSLNTISVGQAVVASEETKDTIFRAGFLSAVKAPKADEITFSSFNYTKTENNISTVTIQVNTTTGAINKLLYRINGKDDDPDKFYEYKELISSGVNNCIINSSKTIGNGQEINVSTVIAFNSNFEESKIQFYAQYYVEEAGAYSSKESTQFTVYTTKISTDTFEIISPDKTMGTAALDPLIETTPISLTEVSSITFSLNNSSVTISTSVLMDNGIIDVDTYKIKCNYSKLAKITDKDITNNLPPSLLANAKYTLEISLSDVNLSDSVEFKVIGTGVADIYIYPSPFKPKQQNTTIQFLLAYDSDVTINLYDKAGKIVCQLIKNEHYGAGINKVEWDGRNYAGQTLAVGAYICEVIAKSTTGNGEHRRYTALAIGK